MKALSITSILFSLTLGSLHAQEIEVKTASEKLQPWISLAPVEAPNEIRIENISYSGVFVQISKTDNPLQLLNPKAPARYGYGEMNLVESHPPKGLKFFAINF